jgi:hypothetical protein
MKKLVVVLMFGLFATSAMAEGGSDRILEKSQSQVERSQQA